MLLDLFTALKHADDPEQTDEVGHDHLRGGLHVKGLQKYCMASSDSL